MKECIKSINDALTDAKRALSNVSSTAILDAELLLMHVLNVDRVYLYSNKEKLLTQKQREEFDLLIKRRENGEPIAYILGYKEFWSLKFMVTSDVLIPRPETELLVELVLRELQSEGSLNIADLGTGSGALAISVAMERPCWNVVATDVSNSALDVAKDNAKSIGVYNVNFCCGIWCFPLADSYYDAIISNPPYIKDSDECFDRKEMNFEPLIALKSGVSGLDAISAIVKQAKNKLKIGGWLFLEHGYDQGAMVAGLLEQDGYRNISCHSDLAGIGRVVMGMK